jgi:hypothetical protein
MIDHKLKEQLEQRTLQLQEEERQERLTQLHHLAAFGRPVHPQVGAEPYTRCETCDEALVDDEIGSFDCFACFCANLD